MYGTASHDDEATPDLVFEARREYARALGYLGELALHLHFLSVWRQFVTFYLTRIFFHMNIQILCIHIAVLLSQSQ